MTARISAPPCPYRAVPGFTCPRTQLTRPGFVNAYQVREADGLSLVDTTTPKTGHALLAAARAAGAPIRRIALTHGHVTTSARSTVPRFGSVQVTNQFLWRSPLAAMATNDKAEEPSNSVPRAGLDAEAVVATAGRARSDALHAVATPSTRFASPRGPARIRLAGCAGGSRCRSTSRRASGGSSRCSTTD